MFQEILVFVHILICILLVMLVLVQQGKGATMGSSFGSGASQTVFGSQGSGTFLFKMTGILAVLFFANSLSLVYFAVRVQPADTVVSSVESMLPQQDVAPTPVLPAQAPTEGTVPVEK